jgi:hypothetical protein
LDDALRASNWSHGVYGAGAARISFNTIRRCVAGTVVEERVQVGSIEVEAEARTDNCVLLELIAGPEAWAEALVIALVNGVRLYPLEGEPVGRGEFGPED